MPSVQSSNFSSFLPRQMQAKARTLSGGETCPNAKSITAHAFRIARFCILHIFIDPVDHFVEHVLGGLFSAVAVGFQREHDKAGGAAETAECRKQTLGLDRERAGVIVGFAVY